MKKFLIIAYSLLVLILIGGNLFIVINEDKINKKSESKLIANTDEAINNNITDALKVVDEQIVIKHTKVYDNLTMDELVAKLNRSLHSTLSGKGEVFAKYSLKYGVDPYMAVAISLHETGCKWSCSSLVKSCNNVGGQKGSPGCNGGSYKRFSTLDEGIEKFIKNIAVNYVQKGLNTPEKMQSKYAGSTSWAAKVNSYISSIKSA